MLLFFPLILADMENELSEHTFKTSDEHNQFGIILELYKKTRVELYRNGKLFSKYHFYLQKNNNYNFYPLQMQSPDKEIEKTVVITNSGEIKVSVKNLN